MDNSAACGSNNQACAVCRFQRRRCNASCPLAKYFPAKENQKFMSCKKLFGVSNMLRLLNQVTEKDRDDTMKSFMFEAEIRDRDPVFGCMGVINELQHQVDELKQELALAKAQLVYIQEHVQEASQDNKGKAPRTSNLQLDGFHEVHPRHALLAPSSPSANVNLQFSFF